MKKVLLMLALVYLAGNVVAQQYRINAQVTGFPNGAKFYLNDVDVDSNIDSAIVKDNHFELKGKLTDTPKSLWLSATVNNKFYYTVLLMGNEQLTIRGDIKDFPFDLSITGSKTQDVNNLSTGISKDYYKKRNQLLEQYFALTGDSAKVKGKKIWKVINHMDSVDAAARKNFVITHLNSYAGLNDLFYLNNKFPKDSLLLLYKSISPEFKKSRFAQRIGTYLKVGDVLKKGDQATDFEAFDAKGMKHRLSDIKGKYTLLDFSSTYCGPCMQSISDLQIIAKQYKSNLQIITFSGDGGKETWLTGFKRDKPTWLSLWDGKGSYGETILKYGASGFPTFVLIGPNNKIIDTWSGYGKDPGEKGSLETKMAKLMPQPAQ